MFDKIKVGYKMSIQEANSNQKIQILKIKAEIGGLQTTPKKSCFIASISSIESMQAPSLEINYKQESKIICQRPISMKIVEGGNNLRELYWEIPIHQCLTLTNYKQYIEFSSLNKLTICYISDEERKQKDFIIQFNKFYDMHVDYFMYDNENESLQKAIQHELILQRSGQNRIPIILRLNSTVFYQFQNQKIEIKLQSRFLKHPLPQVEVVLYNRVIFDNMQQAYHQLTQRISKKLENVENNNHNSEVDFELDLGQLQNIAPLYLGQKIESHHILLIKVIFEKQNCCDWSQRKFDIFVPIEIITQNPEIDENINQNPDIIELDVWPHFCQLYQNYLKVKVLKEQNLKIL
ncbi:unnamed protein product (macronuclear) [Paramecium tetraurelia]|uniref:Chromosome undetermined scaffold_1, whole genome shotgun sequence n=1 Tax=Paramecium tetraurelia TaxID=5888 RepID=Q6BG15_PARTE|nr:hypothetical protein [Paramecium tetraurelia strain d4-2]XP_001423275.1 uncharacterized protein GSPATT00000312001 [Paramecium tetraurelia]CAH03405.1 hypothetical protein PTMB.208 [Paramecium tetraurelia]CAK55877.1 unnamed protein product [Paramecium tetraurelia]|eukprot:XP_001423275.1 hypothetical protein (macronuclear) [Paramecium tetraurelia strain d4-2]